MLIGRTLLRDAASCTDERVELTERERERERDTLFQHTHCGRNDYSINWAVIWGGAKRMGGGKRTRERALQKFLDPSKRASGLLCRGFLYRKNRAVTPEGSGKRTVRGGVQNPFLGGVSFVRFSTPLFFSTPPWRPLN